KRAALSLAISDASRQEGLAHIGLPADRVVNTSAAMEADFQPIRVDDTSAARFSWDESAKRAMAAWASLRSERQANPVCRSTGWKPRLAFVSPLPPERTGIADYSAELLPALAEHYDIDVVVAQDRVDDPWINEHCAIRDVRWFLSHAGDVDRALYHFGTIEPRKGYLQVLEAFTQLWQQGLEINLVIVGKEGWTDLPDDMRRTIPEIIRKLHSHPELGKRLFWLEGISDEYLEMVYAASACLIAASYGEGFVLTLIEAARHQLPIITRDIPVFREVAGEHAFYFTGEQPDAFANAVKKWSALYSAGKHPKGGGIKWSSWKESSEALTRVVIGGKWPPYAGSTVGFNEDEVRRYIRNQIGSNGSGRFESVSKTNTSR